MKKIISLIDKSELLKGIIFSIILLFVLIVGYTLKRPTRTIWIIQFIVQAGVATLWWVAKAGIFSIPGYSFKKIGASFRMSKTNKLGAYKHGPKKVASKPNSKNISGVLFMYLFATIELLVYISIRFA